MARFDVVLEDQGGVQRNCRLHIEAASPAEALLRARGAMPPARGDHVYAVYRHRRARRRALVGYFAGPTGNDGTAGVREPRRPLPNPPSLRAAAAVPARYTATLATSASGATSTAWCPGVDAKLPGEGA